MSTRIYLPSGPANILISPSPDAGWENTANLARVTASYTKTNVVFATQTSAADATAGASDRDVIMKQFVIAIPTGTHFDTSHTIKGRVLCSESNGALNARSQCVIRVIASDASTVRATLRSYDTAALANEFVTTLTNRQMPRGATVPVAVDYTSVADDYLVIEIGWRKQSTDTSRTVSMRFGDNNASDLAEDETATADANTWIEFSTDFANAAATDANGDVIAAVQAFGGSAGTELAVDQTLWTKDDTGDMVITAQGRARGNVQGAGNFTYHWDTLPSSAEYDVRCNIVRRAGAVADSRMEMAARLTGVYPSGSFYTGGYQTGPAYFLIVKFLPGPSVSLLNQYNYTPVLDANYAVEFRVRDGSQKLIVDGVLRISATDTSITAANQVGIFHSLGGSFTGADANDLQIDNFSAQDVLNTGRLASRDHITFNVYRM